LSESLIVFLLKLILITFYFKKCKIKSQIDVDLFTYIWLSKIIQVHSRLQLVSGLCVLGRVL